MMKCPLCGRPVSLSHQLGRMVCSSCGWGTGQVDQEALKRQRRARAGRSGEYNVYSLILTWLVAGGLVALIYYLVFGVFDVERSTNNLAAFFTILAAYSALGYLIRPRVDREKLGWLGGLIDNPFSFRDNWERWKLQWLIVLYPGRIIAGAVVGLFRFIFSSRARTQPPFKHTQ